MAILSKACKPDNFESHSSLKLNFTNIQVLHWKFLDWESFLESNSPDTLHLCETKLNGSIDSGNFSMRGYLSLIRKDSNTHGQSGSLFEGRTCFSSRLISRQLCRLLLMFQTDQSPSSSLCLVFDSILCNIDEVLSINPSTNVFVYGNFNIHHKDWLTYSSGTNRSGELCYNFSISNYLTQMINSPTCIADCDSTVLLFWIYFL